MIYIPYFRGKQFDLAALKEAVLKDLLASGTIPLIEPVRDSPHLRKTLEAFIKKEREILVVINPEVGQVQMGVPKLYEIDDLLETPYVIPCYIINEAFQYHWIKHDDYVFLSKYFVKDILEEAVGGFAPRFHLIADSARLRKAVHHRRILLGDPFTRLKNSADYLQLPDEFFSDEMKFAKEEGYLGYSDYGIDGAAYYDKGWASRAVVLHILYLDKYGNLRIKHFCSDSNESAANPAGKFFEALEKLAAWHRRYEKEIPLTAGLSGLLSYLETGKYPGGGTIKKWSVMHQLELVQILERQGKGDLAHV